MRMCTHGHVDAIQLTYFKIHSIETDQLNKQKKALNIFYDEMDRRLIIALLVIALIAIVLSRPQWESANYDCIGSPSLGGFSTWCGFNKKR
ncbi:unnamed protein product [Toxocara canis]|uniref:Inner membrane protein n=1 Tax=Toxocara canis TaxID=6265 RepID=A0A183VEG7_TOXCA|nr:unnamed protein product [Toxocara canis]